MADRDWVTKILLRLDDLECKLGPVYTGDDPGGTPILVRLDDRINLMFDRIRAIEKSYEALFRIHRGGLTALENPEPAECYGGVWNLEPGKHKWSVIEKEKKVVGRECARCELRQIGTMIWSPQCETEK